MNYPSPVRQLSTLPRSLVVNKSAVCRILKCIPSHILDLAEQGDTVSVRLIRAAAKQHGQQVEISLTDLETEFHRFRMESGSSIEAHYLGEGHYGHRWDVRGSRGDLYQVEQVGDHYRCTCEDWHQHGTRCKHGWAAHFAQEAAGRLSCGDCRHWSNQVCKLRESRDLEPMPITYAEICPDLFIDFEEF
jgi:hypothetical protein